MTTIAWDGYRLVGDKLRSVQGTPVPCTKVFRRVNRDDARWGAVLYGASGDSADCHAFHLWMEADASAAKPTLKNMTFIVITQHGTCLYGEETLVPFDLTVPCFAIGSGADYALGAMTAGRNAIDAVQIASKLDINTGLGVDVLEIAA